MGTGQELVHRNGKGIRDLRQSLLCVVSNADTNPHRESREPPARRGPRFHRTRERTGHESAARLVQPALTNVVATDGHACTVRVRE
jgi:hypothetical protein